MTDQFHSRLLVAIREKNKVKSVKDIESNGVIVEMYDGTMKNFSWKDIFKTKKYNDRNEAQNV